MGLITVFEITIVARQQWLLIGHRGFGSAVLDLGLFVASL